MADLRSPRNLVIYAFQFLVLFQTQVSCWQYKVGDLHAWGLPSSSNPLVYTYWSKYHTLTIGDSLLFLYPPSQDSLIQVTEENYNACNLKDPVLYMNNGNSLFNITKYGDYYFTSGASGHCEKKQKIHISVLSGNGVGGADGPASSALPDSAAPSYPTVFESIPLPPSSLPASSSSASHSFSIYLSAFVASIIFASVN